MSMQICRIRGIGYKFNYEDLPFSFLDNEDKEHDFLNVINRNLSYYSLRDMKINENESLIGMVTDGMGGTYKYILVVTEATYVDNTHYDDYWQNKFRNDEYVREYAKQNIETFLQRKMDIEPQEFEFLHYS